MFDLNFEVVNRFRGTTGTDAGDAGDAVEALKPLANSQAVSSDEGFSIDTLDRVIGSGADGLGFACDGDIQRLSGFMLEGADDDLETGSRVRGNGRTVRNLKNFGISIDATFWD